MANYYLLVARAVSDLPQNTAEARRALYERELDALVAELRRHSAGDADLSRERRLMEAAIRNVENDATRGEQVKQASSRWSFRELNESGPVQAIAMVIILAICGAFFFEREKIYGIFLNEFGPLLFIILGLSVAIYYVLKWTELIDDWPLRSTLSIQIAHAVTVLWAAIYVLIILADKIGNIVFSNIRIMMVEIDPVIYIVILSFAFVKKNNTTVIVLSIYQLLAIASNVYTYYAVATTAGDKGAVLVSIGFRILSVALMLLFLINRRVAIGRQPERI